MQFNTKIVNVIFYEVHHVIAITRKIALEFFQKPPEGHHLTSRRVTSDPAEDSEMQRNTENFTNDDLTDYSVTLSKEEMARIRERLSTPEKIAKLNRQFEQRMDQEWNLASDAPLEIEFIPESVRKALD